MTEGSINTNTASIIIIIIIIRERERERKRDRERETHTHTDRETERQRDGGVLSSKHRIFGCRVKHMLVVKHSHISSPEMLMT